VLLNDLVKPGIVQTGEISQIIDVTDDVAELGLKQLVLGLGRAPARGGALGDDGVDLGLGGLDAQDDLVALDLLKRKDLVELALELVDEALLVVVGPGDLGGRSEGVFELLVLDVLPLPVGAFGRREVDAEPGSLAGGWSGQWSGVPHRGRMGV
jgi:hypothetical protein